MHKTEDLTSHTQSKSSREKRAELKDSSREKDEEKEEIKNGSAEGEDDDRSSETKVEEKEDTERGDDVTENATNSNSGQVERLKSEVILHKHMNPSVFINTDSVSVQTLKTC